METLTSPLELLRQELPELAKDARLNLQSVMDESSSLTPAQKWGTAVACAVASRNPRLREAILADALALAGAEAVEDGQAAAVLMAMNNVYYRFRHMVGKPSYQTRPARLRMNRLAQVKTSQADFELMCLAVSAINGCEACLRAHEEAVLKAGLGEDQVHDAVRIAATIMSVAVGLEA